MRISRIHKDLSMRPFIMLALLFSWSWTASALTPLLDSSPGFFAGEWAGHAEQGGYCYLNLNADGTGLTLIDGGTGDWLGARMQWRNQQQSLLVESITSMPVSAQQRIMPLDTFVLRTGFNQSLNLSWSPLTSACQLQKLESTARHLERARSAMHGLLR